MSQKIYEEVTAKIIAELEKGAIPWIKNWQADSSADKNFVSQKPYKGINRLLLGMSSMAQGFNNPAWATYPQWQEKGFNVKKGEKATQIVFYKKVTKDNKETNSIDIFPVLKTYFVFNVEQTDAQLIKSENDVKSDFEINEHCENTLLNTGAIINHGGDAAFYMPSQDKIQLPNKNAFDAPCHYYATAFHELSHWTGSKNRLDRNQTGKYGNPDYAFEELIAEMSAAYLCADHSIKGELRHAGYIQSWLKACRENDKAIFKAAAEAQKACDFITNFNQIAIAA